MSDNITVHKDLSVNSTSIEHIGKRLEDLIKISEQRNTTLVQELHSMESRIQKTMSEMQSQFYKELTKESKERMKGDAELRLEIKTQSGAAWKYVATTLISVVLSITAAYLLFLFKGN